MLRYAQVRYTDQDAFTRLSFAVDGARLQGLGWQPRWALDAGIEDLDAKYDRDEMVRADVLFSATGVTDGSILQGAHRVGDYLETETLLMRSRTGSVRRLFYRTKHF